jgi:hypothetical protein
MRLQGFAEVRPALTPDMIPESLRPPPAGEARRPARSSGQRRGAPPIPTLRPSPATPAVAASEPPEPTAEAKSPAPDELDSDSIAAEEVPRDDLLVSSRTSPTEKRAPLEDVQASAPRNPPAVSRISSEGTRQGAVEGPDQAEPPPRASPLPVPVAPGATEIPSSREVRGAGPGSSAAKKREGPEKALSASPPETTDDSGRVVPSGSPPRGGRSERARPGAGHEDTPISEMPEAPETVETLPRAETMRKPPAKGDGTDSTKPRTAEDASSRSRPAAPSAPGLQAQEPVVTINIGRIEVKAVNPPDPRPDERGPTLSLEEYMKRRNSSSQ